MFTRNVTGVLALVFSMFALNGCGSLAAGSGVAIPNLLSPGSPPITLTGNPLTDFAPITDRLGQMTMADVDRALTDAQGRNPVDGVGVACWSTVKIALPALTLPKAAGIATAIQRGRDLQIVGPVLINQCASIIPFLGSIPRAIP